MVQFSQWNSLATSLVFWGLASAAKNITIYASDTSVNYEGYGWKPYAECRGTQFSYEVGNSFSAKFKGTAVYLYGTRASQGGVLAVEVDGYQSNVDRSSTEKYICGEALYSRTDLPYTDHEMTVTFSGQSEGMTNGTGFIDWQWLLYTVPEATDPTSSLHLESRSSTYGSQISSYADSSQSNQSNASKRVNVAPIVGGVLGGVAALLGIAAFIFWRRKKANSSSSREKIEIDGEPHYPSMGSQIVYNSLPFTAPTGVVTEYSRAQSHSLAGSIQQPQMSNTAQTFPWMQQQENTSNANTSQHGSLGHDSLRTSLLPVFTGAPFPPPPVHSNAHPIHRPIPSPAPSSFTSPSTISSPPRVMMHLGHQTTSPPPSLTENDVNRIASRVTSITGIAGPSSAPTPAPGYHEIESNLRAQNLVETANGRMDAPPSYDRKNL